MAGSDRHNFIRMSAPVTIKFWSYESLPYFTPFNYYLILLPSVFSSILQGIFIFLDIYTTIVLQPLLFQFHILYHPVKAPGSLGHAFFPDSDKTD